MALIDRFPVQEDEAANHPQPETDASTPKSVSGEREIWLQAHEGYLAVQVDERTGIVAGELALKGAGSGVEMAEELGDFLFARREIGKETRVVFAGARDGLGPGELLRLYGWSGVEEAGLIEVRLNGGQLPVYIGDVGLTGALPGSFALHPNAPNPFNPETEIRFDLPEETGVRLEVFDALGQKVRTLVAERLPAGAHRVTWDGRSDEGTAAGSGVYFYRLTGGIGEEGFSQVRRMLLIK